MGSSFLVGRDTRVAPPVGIVTLLGEGVAGSEGTAGSWAAEAMEADEAVSISGINMGGQAEFALKRAYQ